MGTEAASCEREGNDELLSAAEEGVGVRAEVPEPGVNVLSGRELALCALADAPAVEKDSSEAVIDASREASDAMPDCFVPAIKATISRWLQSHAQTH